MSTSLQIIIGQYSDKGRKAINQDFHGAYVPDEPQLTTKGIAVALADGISSSDVGHIASEATVTGFLEDYYCTSDAWTVKKSVQQVLTATNSWLYSQTQQSKEYRDENRGMVCTLSALVFKSTTAHLFHVGDTRIYQYREGELEQLTTDHRVWVSAEKNFLSRAMGVNYRLDIDYQSFSVEQGDRYLLLTDGVYEAVETDDLLDALQSSDLDSAAKALADKAYENGSTDNLTVQLVDLVSLPEQDVDDVVNSLNQLPFPPDLAPDMILDGFKVIRELHASNRTQVYLAEDTKSQTQVILKTPSVNYQDDPAYLERFLMEEWIARRINSVHVLKAWPHDRERHFLYYATEYIEGQTLAQWIIDNPEPSLEVVRGIAEQIEKGLRAFHRLEMLHQDLKPDNIMIEAKTGTVKIIDFGSTRVAGMMEITSPIERDVLLGTKQYTAPEYHLNTNGSNRSDLFSFGVIIYEMLSGQHPYGNDIETAQSKAKQNKLSYLPLTEIRKDIPLWMDAAIRKAVHVDPRMRYEEVSEFTFDLRHPNKNYLQADKPPLMERDPLRFWKTMSFISWLITLILLYVILMT